MCVFVCVSVCLCLIKVQHSASCHQQPCPKNNQNNTSMEETNIKLKGTHGQLPELQSQQTKAHTEQILSNLPSHHSTIQPNSRPWQQLEDSTQNYRHCMQCHQSGPFQQLDRTYGLQFTKCVCLDRNSTTQLPTNTMDITEHFSYRHRMPSDSDLVVVSASIATVAIQLMDHVHL